MAIRKLIGLSLVVALSTSAGAALLSTGLKRPKSADWRLAVVSTDLARIRNWRKSFVAGLAQAKSTGNSENIAREGALLDPDSGRDSALPPTGAYQCRVIKMGKNGVHMQPYVAYPRRPCAIHDEGGVSSFSFSSGSGAQRPNGLIFSGDDRRRIFLGTMMLSDERRMIDYGRDQTRNMAGLIERIGETRWRLILPYPNFESLIDVIEIAPVTATG
jgi:Domain of unknown function (DUF4893)